jgi:hypothetical protein
MFLEVRSFEIYTSYAGLVVLRTAAISGSTGVGASRKRDCILGYREMTFSLMSVDMQPREQTTICLTSSPAERFSLTEVCFE